MMNTNKKIPENAKLITFNELIDLCINKKQKIIVGNNIIDRSLTALVPVKGSDWVEVGWEGSKRLIIRLDKLEQIKQLILFLTDSSEVSELYRLFKNI